VNTIAPSFSCKAGKIESFSLKQSASAQYPVLREQRVQLGLFSDTGKELKLDRKLAVTYKGASTEVPELKGVACPALVYPNYEDWGFVKARLDQRSFATVRSSVRKVHDPMLRTMLWQSMWDGVRDGELPLNEFLQTALNNLPAEKDYALLGDVLAKTGSGLSTLEKMAPDAAYTRRTNDAFEKMAWEQSQSEQGDQNYKRRWLNSYVGHAMSKPDLDRLAAILDGKVVLKGLTLSQDQRWLMLQALSLRNYAGIDARLAAEQERDKSDSGQAAALEAAVMRPDPKVKAERLAQIHDLQTKLPFGRVRTMMENLYPHAQARLNEQTAAERLAGLPALDKAAGPVYMRAYGASMLPMTCTPENVARLKAAAEQYKDLAAGTRRALLVAHQEDARCVSIRKAMTVPLK
jgi:aminopeptidase N